MHTGPAPGIHRRNFEFRLAGAPRWWHGGDCHRTRLFDALSLFFPEGERFFIDSVRHYRERIPAADPLQGDVHGFIGQEAVHGREHRRYNQRLERQGLPLQALDGEVRDLLDFVRGKAPPGQQLAITICLEHFTAMLAHELLSNPAMMAGADPEMLRLWRWHAMEETEHKAVAFDVYERTLHAGPARRYLLRCWTMLSASFYFSLHTWAYLIRLARADGRGGDWRGWLRLLRFMFGRPGPFRRIFPRWLEWFRPGFHPWQHDNRGLLGAVRGEFEAAG